MPSNCTHSALSIADFKVLGSLLSSSMRRYLTINVYANTTIVFVVPICIHFVFNLRTVDRLQPCWPKYVIGVEAILPV
jgi:hypothetical protein